MVRLPRTVWIQLAILAAVTVIAGGIMAFGFVNVPALIGIGRYNVILELPSSGGLYPTSVVTYRGSEVGRVTSVEVTRDGVQAVLKLDSSTKIPSDVTAEVHSRSAVGEQFVQLIPSTDDSDANFLRAGDVIGVDRVQVPPEIGSLLDATNQALQAIPQDNLRTVVDEAATAVAGLGPELSRIVDGSTALAIEAGRTVDPITKLIDQSPPVLNSQVQTADSIETWANRMASITGQLKAQDTAFAGLLTQGGPALEEGRALFDRMAPALPILLADMVSLGDIAVAYRSDIEQLLVLFPQGTAVMSAIILPNSGTKQDYKGVYLDFNLNLNLPPPCNTGFLPVRQQRSPSLQDAPERPAGELYCRVPQDSGLNVRGVRNIPCETVPGKRAPSVEICESDEQYVPLNDGYNWKGDPNATLSGQGVPQYAPGLDPRLPPPAGTGTAIPPAAAPPPPVVAVPYDPATGEYVGPDGQRHTQANLAHAGNQTWQSMLIPPG
ncbi:mammalian cell entry protein [Mycolicibacterium moriokaense]|uniref:Mammalian cell entry protein n=1 Tax=Mycolicibacterium moriokaense TaxID=39691 RepID=A0AAD1H8M6_9MYCO|nr:MlaD family protein [Mycolicibacterium moriokaense]MCV7040935.1 MCE family protein [Mycolicibacterium moriokaense]ORB21610.1 mammalian cell entry protein [Mycolicibacterium moriokaense]BBX00494.1 mammalian cell entry protein [Mycolicibacterium moriokaense]